MPEPPTPEPPVPVPDRRSRQCPSRRAAACRRRRCRRRRCRRRPAARPTARTRAAGTRRRSDETALGCSRGNPSVDRCDVGGRQLSFRRHRLARVGQPTWNELVHLLGRIALRWSMEVTPGSERHRCAGQRLRRVTRHALLPQNWSDASGYHAARTLRWAACVQHRRCRPMVSNRCCSDRLPDRRIPRSARTAIALIAIG